MQIDQQLKERLVGATVLFLAGILVIPLLLDGPQTSQPVRVGLELPAAQSDSQTHTIRLDVPASQPAGNASGTIGRAAPPSTQTVATRGQPAATDEHTSGPEPAAADEPAAGPEPATADERAAKPVSAPAAGDRRSETKVAETRQTPTQEPQEAGTAVTAPPGQSGGSVSTDGGWAVQIGSFSQVDNVERISGKLGAAGFNAFSTQIVRGGRTLHRVRVGPVADRSAAEALARRLDAAGFDGRVVSNED